MYLCTKNDNSYINYNNIILSNFLVTIYDQLTFSGFVLTIFLLSLSINFMGILSLCCEEINMNEDDRENSRKMTNGENSKNGLEKVKEVNKNKNLVKEEKSETEQVKEVYDLELGVEQVEEKRQFSMEKSSEDLSIG